jgi:hypothetical protein
VKGTNDHPTIERFVASFLSRLHRRKAPTVGHVKSLSLVFETRFQNGNRRAVVLGVVETKTKIFERSQKGESDVIPSTPGPRTETANPSS